MRSPYFGLIFFGSISFLYRKNCGFAFYTVSILIHNSYYFVKLKCVVNRSTSIHLTYLFNSSVPRSVERNRIYYTTYNLKSFSALKPKDACFSRYFSISVISSMYFRRTIARPRMAVTHHEPAVLYPVCIRVILAKFLLLNLMRIIINGFSVYFC